MSRYHLDVDVVGAASTGISGRSAATPRALKAVENHARPASAEASKGAPALAGKSTARTLPGGDVGSSTVVAVLLLAVAAAGFVRFRPRRPFGR
jgi:hypothetical protein